MKFVFDPILNVIHKICSTCHLFILILSLGITFAVSINSKAFTAVDPSDRDKGAIYRSRWEVDLTAGTSFVSLQPDFDSWDLSSATFFGAGADYSLSTKDLVDFRVGLRLININQTLNLESSEIRVNYSEFQSGAKLGLRIPSYGVRLGGKMTYPITKSGTSTLTTDRMSRELNYISPKFVMHSSVYLDYLISSNYRVGVESGVSPNFFALGVGYDF